MLEYADGRPAEIGDLVIGRPAELGHDVIGLVMGIGIHTGAIVVACVTPRSFVYERWQSRKGFKTFDLPGTQMVVADMVRGECKDFRLVHREAEKITEAAAS